MFLSVLLDELFNELEGRFVVGTDVVFIGIEYCMVVLVRITLFVHEEHYRYVLLGKRPVVAIFIQLVSVQCLEITLFGIYLFEQGVSIHSYIVEFAILLRVIVGNHVEVEEELDLA